MQFIRYTFAGGLAFAVDFTTLFLFTEYLNIHYLTSAGIAFIFGLIVNYTISVNWVFAKRTIKDKKLEFLIFMIIGITGFGLNELFLWVFTDYLAIYYLISKILVTVIVLLWNFGARKILLFNK